MKTLLIFGLFILSLSSFSKVEAFNADSKGGGGGDAYVCFAENGTASYVDTLLKKKINPFNDDIIKKIKTIRLLDLVEIPEGDEYLFPGVDTGQKKSIKEVREQVYRRLNLLLPTYAELIQNHSDLRYIPNRALPEINDENIKFSREPNCVFVQIAIQDIGTGDVNYFRKLYELLPPIDIAALDFHEKLLRNHFNNGAENSYYVRKLVGFLFSKHFHQELNNEKPKIDKLMWDAAEEFERYPVFKNFRTKHSMFDSGQTYVRIIESIEPRFKDDLEHTYFMLPTEYYMTERDVPLIFDPIDLEHNVQVRWNFDVETEGQSTDDIDLEELRFTFHNKDIASDPDISLSSGLEKKLNGETFFLHSVDYYISEQPNNITGIKIINGAFLNYNNCNISTAEPKLISEFDQIIDGLFLCQRNALLPHEIDYNYAFKIEKGEPELTGSSVLFMFDSDAKRGGFITELFPNNSLKTAALTANRFSINEYEVKNKNGTFIFTFDEAGVYKTVKGLGLTIKSKSGELESCANTIATFDKDKMVFKCSK